MIEILELTSRLVLFLSIALVLARVIRGPSVFDRVVALETVALGLVGYLILRSGVAEARLYIDAALGLALFSFTGAVVFAHFIGRGEGR